MALTIDNNNTTITMTVGETKEIELKGNPTTGFSWIAVESVKVENVIEYVQNQCDARMCGVGGVFKIKVTAKESGEGKIVLAYRRPWAPAENDKLFTLNIQIQ